MAGGGGGAGRGAGVGKIWVLNCGWPIKVFGMRRVLSWLVVCVAGLMLSGMTARAGDGVRVYLIGDSTVKNGRGDGGGGLWGWGNFLDRHFDLEKVEVHNRALGGRSSRTYLTEGLWERVLGELRAGDFVLMQFGHNDGGQMFEGNRPRASIKGNGEETSEGVVERTGEREVVRSYGWYLRRYISDARSKGALPIVLTPVPRNMWREGSVLRASKDYGKWAREAAAQGGALFIDLNELVALTYEVVGEGKVRAEYFTEADHTHTTEAGALVNAGCVVAGLRALEGELVQELRGGMVR